MNGKTVLVTGGAGFLGAHFARRCLAGGAALVVNLDKLSYAGDRRRLDDVAADPRYRFLRGDVASEPEVAAALDAHRPQVVVHYAAETHVTRSESAPELFHRTNVEGTRVILEACAASGVERFVHISTDEVYGPILEGAFREGTSPKGRAWRPAPMPAPRLSP